jgi:hypothetical protein
MASLAISQMKAACPSDARTLDVFGRADVTVASFQDTAG